MVVAFSSKAVYVTGVWGDFFPGSFFFFLHFCGPCTVPKGYLLRSGNHRIIPPFLAGDRGGDLMETWEHV